MTSPLPALFVSHGAPTVVLDETPARAFLTRLAEGLPRPRAIVVVSAHWLTRAPVASAAERPETIHDFGGFPEALYRMTYPAPGAPDLARDLALRLRAAGFEGATTHPTRGLDHGAWTPLILAWPDADVPVASLSLPEGGDTEAAFRLGRALAPLRDEGVLILASGAITHALAEFFRAPAPAVAPEDPDARAFADWLAERVEAGDEAGLRDWKRRAPQALRHHPTDEHLAPFFVALGAGGAGRRLHASTAHRMLAMDAYAFG